MTVESADPVVNISSIAKLAPEQLISVKGQVVSVSAVKKISLPQSNDITKLSKQEVVVRDTTTSIRVVLWGDYVNTIIPQVTYLFKHLRIKRTKFEKYLKTPKPIHLLWKSVKNFNSLLLKWMMN